MIEIEDKTSINLFDIDTEDSPVAAVLDFLDKHLPYFSADFKRRTLEPSKIRENLISQELKIFLNRKGKDEVFTFEFQWEDSESKRSPDFAVITVKDRNPFDFTKAFFVIEAKRLPTGAGREKEYVEGNLGGIERFKRGHHGAGLSQSAMIGYVQENDCSHWHTEINKWINDLISNNSDATIFWDSDDLLIEMRDFNKTLKYTSKNTRIVNSITDSIYLFHYLLELC